MRVTKYSDNAPELDTLRETYIYRIAAKVAHHVRPTAQEISYIRREVRRQHAGEAVKHYIPKAQAAEIKQAMGIKEDNQQNINF